MAGRYCWLYRSVLLMVGRHFLAVSVGAADGRKALLAVSVACFFAVSAVKEELLPAEYIQNVYTNICLRKYMHI
jgi:hypothetical protein